MAVRAGDRIVRPDISNRVLLLVSLAIPAAIVAYFLILPSLPRAMRVPGSPVLHLLGVAGAVLLLVPMVFALVKRTGSGESSPAWFVAHVLAASLGTVLVAVHSAGHLGRPPALLLLALAGLIVVGVWARVWLSRLIADTFGTKHTAFTSGRTEIRAALDEIRGRKVDLLRGLDPRADEALFSLTPRHWIRSPRLAARYAALVRREHRLIGTRATVPARQAYWRALHIALAHIFVLGLLVHVITVTFFAGYVSGGGDITWWHLADW